MYCHLGAIPRKPENPDDRLLIMWWDPTTDDFKFSGDSLVDGLGELAGSKLSSLPHRLNFYLMVKSVGLVEALNSNAIVKVYEKPQPKHTNIRCVYPQIQYRFAR